MISLLLKMIISLISWYHYTCSVYDCVQN